MKYLLSALVLFFSTWVQADTLNKIVMFGDSLSDNGNLYEYMKHQLPLSPPYYDGRFSNGPVWIELLAKHYYPDSVNVHLLDYAFGGAGVSETDEIDDDIDENALFNLTREIDGYLLSHHDHADTNSLYIVWMGSNNYMALPDFPDQTVHAVNKGIQKEVERLVEKGATHVMLMTVPDLGRTPGAIEFDSIELLTELTQKHNAMLKDHVLVDLKNKYPQVQWILFDVNEIFLNAVNKPEMYGFNDTTGTCYESVMIEPSSQTILKMAASIQPKANAHACDGYLFFDIIHPTDKAHEFSAEEAVRELSAQHIEFH
jgi:phospholipase/lecithinase/hemolysin